MSNFVVAGSTVAVTGGAGSVGRKAIEQLLARGVGRVRVIDNSESALFALEQTLRNTLNVEFYCCDVAEERELTRCFSNVDYAFHMAALKHVPFCERSPFSAVNVNIRGCESVIRASVEAGLKRVLFTSSDKAVNPTNVMGTSKLMGERLFTAADDMGGRGDARPIFASTRFGNVAGTNGSVIPLFAAQIAAGGPITLTNPRMSRFVMTQDRAAELVLDSMAFAHGGEVFITKMPALMITDLAAVMIDLLAPLSGHKATQIEVRTIGNRPGEKLWEELSTDEESGRVYEGDEYLVVVPPLRPIPAEVARSRYASLGLRETSVTYHSEEVDKMTRREIAEFLLLPGVLDDDIRARLLDAGTKAEDVA